MIMYIWVESDFVLFSKEIYRSCGLSCSVVCVLRICVNFLRTPRLMSDQQWNTDIQSWQSRRMWWNACVRQRWYWPGHSPCMGRRCSLSFSGCVCRPDTGHARCPARTIPRKLSVSVVCWWCNCSGYHPQFCYKTCRYSAPFDHIYHSL